MPPIALRPRSSFEIIDAGVQLLRQHYGELVTISALFMIPVLIGRVFLVPQQFMSPTQVADLTTNSAALAGNSAGLLGISLWGVLSFVFGSLSTAATVVIVSDSYLGREVTVGAAISRVLEKLWVVLGAVLLQGFIVGIGFFFLIIGAVIFGCWFFATTTVVMVEGKGITAALGRSRELARGYVGKIFGTIALAAFLVWLVDFLVGIIVFAIATRFSVGAFALNLGPYVLGIFVVPFINVVHHTSLLRPANQERRLRPRAHGERTGFRRGIVAGRARRSSVVSTFYFLRFYFLGRAAPVASASPPPFLSLIG